MSLRSQSKRIGIGHAARVSFAAVAIRLILAPAVARLALGERRETERGRRRGLYAARGDSEFAMPCQYPPHGSGTAYRGLVM